MTEHETMAQPNLRERWVANPVCRLFVGLFCVFCVSNLLLAIRTKDYRVPNGPEYLLLGIAMGMVGAQVALHAIWTVFGTWNRTIRLSVSVFTALVLYLAFPGFLLFEADSDATIFAVQVLLCMPLSLLAVQAPLWGLKAGWRWGVFRSGVGSDCTKVRALSIQDLLLATTAIAVAVALTRYALTLDGRSIYSGVSIVMFVVPLIAAFASLLMTVTTLLATLRFQNMAFGVWLVTTLEAAVYFGWFVVMCVRYGPPPGEGAAMLIGLFVGFTFSLCAPLCYLRRCGYRLRRADIDPTHEGT